MSRFVKAAFTRLNSVSGESESESISQFFHILGSVEQQKDYVILEMKTMNTRFILLAAIQIKGSITIVRMKIVKSLQSI